MPKTYLKTYDNLVSLNPICRKLGTFSIDRRRIFHVVIQRAASVTSEVAGADKVSASVSRLMLRYTLVADKEFVDLTPLVVEELDHGLEAVLEAFDELYAKISGQDPNSPNADMHALASLTFFRNVLEIAADGVDNLSDDQVKMMLSYSVPIGEEISFPFLDAFLKDLDEAIMAMTQALVEEDESPLREEMPARKSSATVRMLRLRVTLEGVVNPPVWRVIDVPDTFSFDRLHLAIQCCMPWDEKHLYNFIHKSAGVETVFEIPEPNAIHTVREGAVRKDARRAHISKYFVNPGDRMEYVYDFGDNWIHTVELECALESDRLKPICVDGRGACPPEDCGGVDGYEHLKKVMSGIHDEQYRDMKIWLGLYPEEDYWPDSFDLKWFNEELETEFGAD